MKTRSLIFTIYGDYIGPDREIWIGSLIQLLEQFGHNSQAVRAAVSRMYRQGWIEARKVGNNSFYSLTDQGRKRIKTAAKRIYKIRRQPWDGKWRILIYNIPEEKRDLRAELRKELSWIGLAPLSTSCWISPSDVLDQIGDVVNRYGLKPWVETFLAESRGEEEDARLVAKGWELDKIETIYKDFIDRFEARYQDLLSRRKKGQLDEAWCFVERTNLVHEYRKILFYDPELPEGFYPQDGVGNTAINLFWRYYKALAEPAQRFFDQVYRSAPDQGGEESKNAPA